MAERQAAALGRGGDGIAPSQSLLREGRPHGAGEVAAEGGQSNHRVLRAVHAARQGGHEGDGDDHAHDLPGAKTPAAGAGRVHRTGHRVPEQEEAGEHQHAAVEDEEHVAEHGMTGHAHVAQEGEQVPRGVVCGCEYLGIDGLGRGGTGGQAGRTEGHETETEGREGGAEERAGTPLPLQQAPPTPLSARRSVRERPHASSETTTGAPRIAERAADLGCEEEAQDAHGHSAAAPGSARPGRRRISSAASARRAASKAPRRSSRRKRSQSSMSEMDCSIASSRSRLPSDISCRAINTPGSSKRRLASSSSSS